MSIFKKEDQEEFEEEQIKTFKKPKDLNPQNIRKRKEIVKPWGKKERLIVLISFLATILIAGFLFLSSRSWKLPNFRRIEIPKFELFKSETVTIGNKAGLQKERETLIKDYFVQETNKLTGLYSFYIIDLKEDREFGFREKNIMQAASLIKLPVFALLYQEVEAGKLNLDDIHVLKNTDKITGSGSLEYKDPGFKISYRDLAKLMGKESDNTAFNIFVNLLGEDKVQRTINDIGMFSTSLKENRTSAYDVSIFYKKLFKGEIVSQKYTDEILSFLTDTIYEDYIPKEISEVKIAHKYGREINVTNDAGIILSENPFVLSILSEGIVYSEGDVFIPGFSKFVFEKMK